MSEASKLAGGVAPDETGTLQGLVAVLRRAAVDPGPHQGLMRLAAGQLEDMARRIQPKVNVRGDIELVAESGVSAATGEGRVHLSIGETTLQTTPTAARGYALQILAAAADAESEAAVTAELRALDFPLPLIGNIIAQIRSTRQAREAKGATTA